jgi:hypothetical protein
MQEGRSFDSRYAAELSDDAVPALLEAIPILDFEQQCTVKNKLSHRLETANTENDFRSWNWSRYIARREMAQTSLDAANCPPHTQNYYDDF